MNLADGSFPSVRGYKFIKLFMFKGNNFVETPALTRKKEICIIMIQACPVICCDPLLVAMSVGMNSLRLSPNKSVTSSFYLFFLFVCTFIIRTSVLFVKCFTNIFSYVLNSFQEKNFSSGGLP